MKTSLTRLSSVVILLLTAGGIAGAQCAAGAFNARGCTTVKESTAPTATPIAGEQYVYFKSGAGLCAKDATGAERCTGGIGSDANTIKGKAVDTPDAAGQQLTYNGAKLVKQTKFFSDPRDFGVDCTLARDSHEALRRWLNQSHAMLVWPVGCKARSDSQIVIGPGIIGTRVLGPAAQNEGGWNDTGIYGCAGEAGGVLKINRSSNVYLEGFAVFAHGGSKCPGGASKFTGSVEIDNTLPGGVTANSIYLRDMTLATNFSGAQITNYFGVKIDAAANLEDIQIIGGRIQCQSSPGSAGVWSAGSNQGGTIIAPSNIGYCYQGVRADGGSIQAIRGIIFNYVGGFSRFGAGGASIYLGGASIHEIAYNLNGEGSGQFLSCNDDGLISAKCGGSMTIHDNEIAVNDMSTSVYLMNLFQGPHVLYNNRFGPNMTGAPLTKTVFGSDQWPTSTPPGTIYDLGGNVFVASGQGWTNGMYPARGYQGGLTTPTSSSLDRTLVTGLINAAGQPIPSPARKFETMQSGKTLDDMTLRFMVDTVPHRVFHISSTRADSTAVAKVDIAPALVGGITTAAASALRSLRVSAVGGGGGNTWGYKVSCSSGGGTTYTSGEITVSSAARLNSSTWNRGRFERNADYSDCAVYRTTVPGGGSPATTGKIASWSVTATANAADINSTQGGWGGDNSYYWQDKGQAGDGTSPPVNTADGRITAAGPISGTTITARDHFLGNITGNVIGNVSGNAGTAKALAAKGTNCSAGNAPLGIDASGNMEGCFAVTLAPVSVPRHHTDACTPGTWAHDTGYLYICHARGDWRRIAWTAGTW